MEHAVYDLILRMTSGNKAVAAVCRETVSALGEGDVCRKLSAEEIDSLQACGTVVTFVDASAKPAEVRTPFVVESGRIYTRRNWQYERNVKERLEGFGTKAQTVVLPDDDFYGSLRPDQRAAVENMCGRQFSILTGGPGTGKTHTIARAVKFVRDGFPELRLGLAAPTGKAAARMKESMQRAMDEIPEATTIHSLLGPNYDLVTFRHNRENPLPLDWLIVDEASMIDLPLMSKLLDALPPTCRLTLVGDADQLASVERGRVFGDLCAVGGDAVSRLTQSTRFPPEGEIARLASAVNGNRPIEALEILRNGKLVKYHDITGLPEFKLHRWPDFVRLVRTKFSALAASRTAEDALTHLNDFRILCATRHGSFGVEFLNQFVRDLMGASCPIPLMITKNDRTLGVSNGDVGIVMPEDPKSLHLPVESGGTRTIRLELLAGTEEAFASTIHKSQGSEFTDVAIVMPPNGDNPLLTREILYTGITRTREDVVVYSGDASIRRCCARVVERLSGLGPSVNYGND